MMKRNVLAAAMNHLRYSSRRSSTAAMAEMGRPVRPRHRHAMRTSNAPASVAAIPDLDESAAGASAVIRDIGCSRRVVLLQPYMTKAEIQGLAYRVQTLTSNESLNSVFIANYVESSSDDHVLPSMIHDRDHPYLRHESVEDFLPDDPDQSFHVAGGYDPLELYKSGKHKDVDYVRDLLQSLTNLMTACEGTSASKIPTIFFPHGSVTDGGFAWLRSNYVLATREAEFRILHPSRGLAFDPVGLSYRLYRVGIEFNQPAAMKARLGCSLILALTGYAANYYDMLETGLATNLVESAASLSDIESGLASIKPWAQQNLMKDPVRFYGHEAKRDGDHNRIFRNVQVADLVNCVSDARADNQDIWTYNDDNDFSLEDPSLETEYVPWNEPRKSDLIDVAYTFHKVFENARNVEGIIGHLTEISNRTTSDPEVQEGIDVAKQMVERMKRQSPLALKVVYRLIQRGSRVSEDLQSCCVREMRAQVAMFNQPDFSLWASQCNADGEYHGPWTHKSVSDVPDDLVEEIVEGGQDMKKFSK